MSAPLKTRFAATANAPATVQVCRPVRCPKGVVEVRARTSRATTRIAVPAATFARFKTLRPTSQPTADAASENAPAHRTGNLVGLMARATQQRAVQGPS